MVSRLPGVRLRWEQPMSHLDGKSCSHRRWFERNVPFSSALDRVSELVEGGFASRVLSAQQRRRASSALYPLSGTNLGLISSSTQRITDCRRQTMASMTKLGAAIWLAISLALISIFACAETPVALTPPTATATPDSFARHPTAPTPTLEERRNQTPTDFGYNTRVVDGDLHVWHVPHCPPVPPATFVAPVIVTDLRSGSQVHLNRDGSVKSSPPPDYRNAEAQDRLSTMLADFSMMGRILAPFECP